MKTDLAAAIQIAYRKADERDRSAWISMQVAKIVVESDDVRSFYLAPVTNRPLPRFEPGQHIIVAPKPVQQNGSSGFKELTFTPRCYTLSAMPDPRYWRITVKRSTVDSPGGSTSRLLHRHAAIGMRLKVSDARGDFTLRSAHRNAPLALLAAGIGITPAYVLAAAAAEDRGRKIWLFLQTTSWDQTPLKDDLIRLAANNQQLQLVIAFSRTGGDALPREQLPGPLPNVHFFAGRLPPEAVAAAVPLPRESHCFACGPTSWMDHLCEALPRQGVTADRIYTESFGGTLRGPQSTQAAVADRAVDWSSQPSGVAGDACRIVLSDAGRDVLYRPNDGSWLDQLQRQGAEVFGGCRAGACGSCMTRLLKGSARMPVGGKETPPDGWVLPCVAEPEGDVTLQL